MKKHTHQRRLIFLIMLVAVLLTACADTGAKSASTPTPTTGTSQAPTAPETTPTDIPATPTPEPEIPYNLDRNNTNLSKYGIETYKDASGVINTTPGFAERLYSDLYSLAVEDGQVVVQLLEVSEGFRKESGNYSFRFAPLPLFDAAKEDKYVFNGSRVSFVIPRFDNSTGAELLTTENVSNETDHAFVIQTVAKASFVPFTLQKTGNVDVLLAVCIDNENGIKDTFVIDKDHYILHIDGEYTAESMDVKYEKITDISVEPVPDLWYMKLMAMAVYNLNSQMLGTVDYFGIITYFFNRNLTMEQVLANAFEQMEISLECGGSSKVIDNADDFSRFAMIFLEGFDTEYTLPRTWMAANDGLIKDDKAITITVKAKEGSKPDKNAYPIVCHLEKDGKLWVESSRFAIVIRQTESMFGLMARAKMLYLPEKTYSYDKVAEFIK